MIGRLLEWLRWLIANIATHADNVTPSLRKSHVIAVGTLGLIGGAVYVALAMFSVMVLRQPFQGTDYGTGFAAIIAALAANVVALAEAMRRGGAPDSAAPSKEDAPVMINSVSAARFNARAVMLVGGAIVAAALLGWVVYTLFIAPGVAKREVLQAGANTRTAETQTDIARDAARTGDSFAATQSRIEGVTHGNTANILAAPGSDTPLPGDLAYRLDAALCLRDQYVGEPWCAGLRGTPTRVD